MYDRLKKILIEKVPLNDHELELIDIYFEEITVKKKTFLLQENKFATSLHLLQQVQ